MLDQPPTGLDYEFRASIATVPARPVCWTSWVQLGALDQARWLPDITDIIARFRSEIELGAGAHAGPRLADVEHDHVGGLGRYQGGSLDQARRGVNVTQTGARATFAMQVNTRFDATKGQVTVLQQSVSTLEGTTATLATQVEATSEGQMGL